MTKCRFCDHSIPVGTSLCPNCGTPVDTSKPQAAEDLEQQVRSLLEQGQKLEAVKRYKDQTGASLKEAKDAVFRLDLDCDGASTQHYLDELGEMMDNLDHERYIRRAIELAAKVPNVPFAAVIVDRSSGQIVAEGWNRSSANPTWHGEIDAINRLAESQPDLDGGQLVLYTTAEPCPMCQGAILWSGIGMVVYGTSIRFLQSQGWRQIDILAEEVVRRSPSWRCKLLGGVLEQECNALFEAASETR